MKIKLPNQSGFTLLEIIIALGLAVVIGVALNSIFVSQTGVFSKQSSVIDQGLSLNESLQVINDQIMQATQVATGYPTNAPTILSSSNALVLKLSAINQSGVIENVYDYVVISRDPSNQALLRLRVYPDAQSIRPSANQVLSKIVDDLTFSYQDKSGLAVTPTSASKITVNLTVWSKIGSQSKKQSRSLTTTLRNLMQ